MDEAWFSKVEPYIFTMFKKRMRNKFSHVSYTTDNSEVTEKKFPCVYFHELEQLETGRDLDNDLVNAIVETIQIQVFSNDAERNKELMTESVLQMKRMRFNVTSMPIYTSENDHTMYMSVARFRRTIGGGDLDLVPQD